MYPTSISSVDGRVAEAGAGVPAVTEPCFGVAPWVTMEVTDAAVHGRSIGLDGPVTIDGRAAAAVATALDRADLTPSALVGGLRAGFEPLAVLSALANLRAAGIVVDRPTGQEDSGAGRSRLPLRVHVAAAGVDAPAVASQLGTAGLAVVDDATASDVQVVFAADYRDPALAEQHARSLAAGRPWCLVRCAGPDVWVGPVLVPGDRQGGDRQHGDRQHGCWECLRRRLAATQPLPRPAVGAGPPPLVRTLAGSLTAALLAGWSAGRGPLAEPGVLWVFDPVAFDLTAHHLAPWPACPECGNRRDRVEVAHPPVRLERTAATGPEVGAGLGSRTASPEQTVRRLRRLVSPILGAVPELRRVEVGPGLHVWQASGNPAVDAAGAVRRSLRRISSGKGDSDQAAEAGALAEALERLQGRFVGDEPRLTARLSELDGAVPPNDVQLFSRRQFAESTGPEASGKDRVPEPFDPDLVVEWTSLWSLTAARPRWLPNAICWFDYRWPGLGWVADSNGCAAGNTLAEAVLAGLLELIERDAVAIWWYNRLRRPAVDLDSAGDPWLAGARRQFAVLGRPVHVLDITSDLGVPAVAAVSAPAAAAVLPADPVLLGFGAHLDRAVAVRRAVGEVAQMVAALPAEPVRTRWLADPVTERWFAEATLDNQPYLRPDPDQPPTPMGAGTGTRDPLADLAEVRSRVEAAELEVLVLDQTRPEIGFPTVRVVAPGLRHFWARFAAGRLYDVPVEQGWLARPVDEVDLNPYPMPM